MGKLQMNQFSLEPLKGAVAALLNDETLSCQVDPNSVATINPGTGMKLTATDAATIVVDKALITDRVIGFVPVNPKQSLWKAGEPLEVCFSMSIMWGEASGTINRGDQLSYVPTGDKLIVTSGNPVCGQALDNAADGDIFRFIVFNALTITTTIAGGTINSTPIGGSSPSTGAFTTLTSTTGTIDFMNQTPLVITPSATPSWTPGLANSLSTLTPGEDETIAAVTTGAVIGKEYFIKVTTSGVTSRTITFGANFKTTGTLATGTVTAKVFVIAFVFDGTNFVEVSRTTAI